MEPVQVWGPRHWRQIHLRAIAFPAYDPGTARVLAEERALRDMLQGLPCESCRSHAMAYLADRPPALLGSWGYQEWGREFHNTVNLRLGRPLFSRADFDRLYAAELAEKRGEWPPRPC